ncbi:hypothetical protein H4R18_004876 [Coemansia javaensis]|uniref:Uncharacterized protein n=1 Tax=Coemansia javaensis TaxID=2761396 RepID=A0A9W8H3Q3_9FUNG|nr:hypothetical protein H4R18_004876 [Coemansia javaensis]
MDYFCCEIFIPGAAGGAGSSSSDATGLDLWLARLFAFVDRHTAQFVWNREPLLLFINTQPKVPRISGRMIHGDAVDDEWLAVWLLREASREFPGLTISVRDSDGEFLLAEAAMHIPQWLTPENSENRVFMREGRLHIIPLSPVTAGGMGLVCALDAVADAGTPTLAPAAAEDAAFARLSRYPDKIRESVHRARCKVPVAVARALAAEPQLIAAAAEAFFARDPAQMRACERMEQFPPEPSATVMVRFNRVQYAKLVSQNGRTPAAFRLPPPDSGAEYRAAVLGMKVGAAAAFLRQLERLGCSAGAPMDEGALAAQAAHVLGRLAADDGPLAGDGGAGSSSSSSDDDDESWLALDGDGLDAAMRGAESVLQDSGEPAARMSAGLQDMLGSFEALLAADAGIDGATMAGGPADDECAEGSDEDVDLDADDVLRALMDAVGADVLEPAADMRRAAGERQGGSDAGIVDVMDAMDRELSATRVGESFARGGPGAGEGLADVDVDLNLVRNMIESFRAQEGLPGPAGTLLGQAGIRLPPPGDDASGSEHEDGDGA